MIPSPLMSIPLRMACKPCGARCKRARIAKPLHNGTLETCPTGVWNRLLLLRVQHMIFPCCLPLSFLEQSFGLVGTVPAERLKPASFHLVVRNKEMLELIKELLA